MKICNSCKENKPYNELVKAKKAKDGYRSWCKDCRKKYRNQPQMKLREKKQQAEYRKKFPDKDKNKWYKYKYGITLEEKRQMYDEQNGKCGICEEDMLVAKDCHLDHNHKTGKIRGILCDTCNRGLGYFQDNPEFLQKAAEYILNKQNTQK